MRQIRTVAWLLACCSGLLELLPFPLAGPAPLWRTTFAWVALTPLLVAVLLRQRDGTAMRVWQSMLVALPAGMIWYTGNCYWIYAVMAEYGNISGWIAGLIQLGFALAGGCYHMLFAGAVAWVFLRTRRRGWALAAAPFFWVAQEFARARITQFPWDQLGVAQVDNRWLAGLAPVGGAYLMSFVLVAVAAVLAAGFLLEDKRSRAVCLAVSVVSAAVLQAGVWAGAKPQPATATAVLLQFNLPVRSYAWTPEYYAQTMADYVRLSGRNCGPYIERGIPDFRDLPAGTPPEEAAGGSGPGAARPKLLSGKWAEVPCPNGQGKIDLIAWPESPAPFEETDERFRHAMEQLAREKQAAVIAQNDALVSTGPGGAAMYNSAAFFDSAGAFRGRYNKVHLVPFGEYVPYAGFFNFAKPLTTEVSDFSKGSERNTFHAGGHTFGVFICYESTFANEVRQFVLHGAEVLVNLSDDGWYGDTSAPWQHLQMVRLRAIESRRWILRATNTGVTAAIDPEGQVTQSVPRHVRTALAAQYGYRDKLTFYIRHGDWFAWTCVCASVLLLGGTAMIERRAM